ncbi:MAG: hypothetical protein GWN86_06415, partial [Desulfobacterales bacterium]|nr:hypothetical protein [Desulfobacterales bacterium]
MPYDMDPASLNARYAEAIRGSHIILFRGSNALLTGDGLREAGLYERDPESGRINFVDAASDYREIRNERQFIIIDGPPDMGGHGLALRDPLQRLCRILFPNPIVTEG